MTDVTLTPDQERFATDAIAQGRSGSLDEVVQASMALLLRAEAESERDGFFTMDGGYRDMTAMLDAMRCPEK